VLLIFLAMAGCSQNVKIVHTLSEIEVAFGMGNLELAQKLANNLLKEGNPDSLSKIRLYLIIDMADRINTDFSLTESEVTARLKRDFMGYAEKERIEWENKNWLEFRVINGEKRYFNRALSNLKLILVHHQSRQSEDSLHAIDPQSQLRLDYTRKVINSATDGRAVSPVKMKVHYRLTVKPDAVPPGEIIRCWLPFPQESLVRQKNVRLVKSVPEKHFLAPDTMVHRSVYLEQKARKGYPVNFELQFEYVSFGQYFDRYKLSFSHSDTLSHLFKKYTCEQPPQIVFTEQIKHLSDSIVTGATNQAEKVRKLYYWINNNIIWTGALEYSIIPFIPGYTLSNKRGDCGMQTLLFMTMARYQNIPVKWQSGWMMHPGEVNLHDWCEVFYEGIGWVPVDMSFNLQKSGIPSEKEFYMSGIDAYRLIINEGIGGLFYPMKKFYRSEPYDFQRGEVEWSGGNLYFNQWDYHMEVDYY
jgi:transglutaminase-like putative cysteine protease